MTMTARTQDDSFQDWLEQINRVCGDFDARTLGAQFTGSIKEYQRGVIRLSEVEVSQASLFRSAREVSAGSNEHFYAVFQLDGQCQLEQEDQRIVLDRGDITLIDASRASTLTYQGRSRQLSLILSHQVLERGLHSRKVACGRRIAAQTPLAVLARSLIGEACRQPHWDLQESEAILDALVTLLRPELGQVVQDADAHERLFEKAISFIDSHLTEDRLCPDWVAKSIGTSTRGLYRLFSRTGQGVAQYIRNRRLDVCADLLRNPQREVKLTNLGLECGFADASHFFTAFKTRFGQSPGEYRKRYGH